MILNRIYFKGEKVSFKGNLRSLAISAFSWRGKGVFKRNSRNLAISALLIVLLGLCIINFVEGSYSPWDFKESSPPSVDKNFLVLFANSINHNTNSLELGIPVIPFNLPGLSATEYLVFIVKSNIVYPDGTVLEYTYHMSGSSSSYHIPLIGEAKYCPFQSYQVEIQFGKTSLSADCYWTGAGYDLLPITVRMRSDVPNYEPRLLQEDEYSVILQLKPKVSAVLLGLFLPLVVVCAVMIYNSWWSTAISLLGVIPLRLILVPPEFQGFTLYDILTLSALIVGAFWLIWKQKSKQLTE
jgi:hypothetical protein